MKNINVYMNQVPSVSVYTKPFGEIKIGLTTAAIAEAEAAAEDAAERAEQAASSVNITTAQETAQYLEV